jgi:hypothetical protein
MQAWQEKRHLSSPSSSCIRLSSRSKICAPILIFHADSNNLYPSCLSFVTASVPKTSVIVTWFKSINYFYTNTNSDKVNRWWITQESNCILFTSLYCFSTSPHITFGISSWWLFSRKQKSIGSHGSLERLKEGFEFHCRILSSRIQEWSNISFERQETVEKQRILIVSLSCFSSIQSMSDCFR